MLYIIDPALYIIVYKHCYNNEYLANFKSTCLFQKLIKNLIQQIFNIKKKIERQI